MAKAYYSVVLDHPARQVWAVIRAFDHYAWAGVPGETIIEDGKRGDQVSAVRRVATGSKIIRQQLLAHSDAERCYTYAFYGKPPYPVRDYTATIRVTPVTENDKAFIEWSATFDCTAEQRDHWIDYFEREGFSRWLAELARFMRNAATNHEHHRSRNP